MINLLDDIRRDAMRLPELRKKLFELMHEIAQVEMRIADRANVCMQMREDDLRKRKN